VPPASVGLVFGAPPTASPPASASATACSSMPTYASVLLSKRCSADGSLVADGPSTKMRRLNVADLLANAVEAVVPIVETKPPCAPPIKSCRPSKRFWADYDDDEDEDGPGPASTHASASASAHACSGNDAW